ncbi:hypothetical protein E1B28_003564 [Marasmius oreades]|uniref:Major facilitator superfamily (MFS) profile domain-containing protein n=1 Tax=Marasmius oreades TaxID=181124 RepID=A0A9P7UKT2_9AGAR|nr:uncharacterized protein E1B28_003564 [Marasmius oreades]KAG7086043.1 hypothetical protein E1B28_003564 [Marasmius oreades]
MGLKETRDVEITVGSASQDETEGSIESKKSKDVLEGKGSAMSAEAAAVQVEFPDGGLRAWLVVVGSAFASFATFGYVTAWGAFQSYYEKTLLKDYSPSTIAWIGSIQYALVFLPALPVGRMFDLGYFRLPFFLFSTLVVVATFLTAECTTFWQLVLCQGILQGAACGCTFGPIIAIISQWFKKRRGLAMGLVTLGSSLGGTVFPIATRRLISQVGFPWAMRILGFILLFALAIPNLTLARRIPGRNVKGGLLNLAAFKFIPYTVWTVASFVTFLGLYTTLTYIDIAAVEVGIPADFSFYLVSITNASSTFGRLSTGLFADRFGPINFMAPTTLAAGILTFAWPFAKSKASLIVVAIIYGAMTGSYVSAFMMPLFEMGELHDIGRRSGMVLSIGAIGALIGPPISGAIKNSTGTFEAVGYYAGSMIVFAVFLMLVTRHLMIGKLWGKF